MAQNIAIENVNNEVANANEVQQLNNKKMEKVNETTVMKMQAVEEARQNLMRAKSVLEANKDAEANIKKSAQVNVGKAETAYFEALKKVELPATKIEVWNEVTNGKIGVCCYSGLAERNAEYHVNSIFYRS